MRKYWRDAKNKERKERKKKVSDETISDNYNMLRMIYTNLCGKYIVKYIIIDTCCKKKNK